MALTQLELGLGLHGRELALPLKNVWMEVQGLRKPGEKFENQFTIPRILNNKVLKGWRQNQKINSVLKELEIKQVEIHIK